MTAPENQDGHSTISIKCIGELVDCLASRISKHNRVLWFRGHRSSSWAVSPSIWRKNYDKCSETDFTNRFRSRAHTRYQSLPNYDNSAIWLSLMQHYGLPTRLLDWTRSPLVATYFALEAYIYEKAAEAEDAVIWILEPHILNEREDFSKFTPSIDAHMCEEMLAPAFTDRAKENDKVVAVMAAETDIRMFVQQGCFTIHSDQTPLEKREHNEGYLSGITIPAKYVRHMTREIDICGFRKGDIYPDLANLATELTNRSLPKA
jgi:hypothetical protein